MASDVDGQTYLLMPEPATMLLLAAGAAGLAARRRKQTR
ncbi:MAG: PEP-CTERM sorting domain-containing protein [Planctomycetota bacterium]|nr:PEP-CTERM sorting domain-containing protein [Planctomycetota bacterium]